MAAMIVFAMLAFLDLRFTKRHVEKWRTLCAKMELPSRG